MWLGIAVRSPQSLMKTRSSLRIYWQLMGIVGEWRDTSFSKKITALLPMLLSATLVEFIRSNTQKTAKWMEVWLGGGRALMKIGGGPKRVIGAEYDNIYMYEMS